MTLSDFPEALRRAILPLSLVKMLSGLNAFGISNIHGGEFKVRSLWKSNVTMLRLARIRRKEFLRTTGCGSPKLDRPEVIDFSGT